MGRRAVSAGILTLGVLILSAIWGAGSVVTRGQRSDVAPAGLPAIDIRLTTDDDVSIAGTFRPGRHDRAPAVLLLHGIGASRQATAGNAAWLAGLGYATLTIDFRGHGQSDTTARTFGYDEARDALAAFRWLRARQGGARIAVLGISLGGAASLIGRDGPLPADAMILQGVYPDLRHAVRNRLAAELPGWAALLAEPLLSFQAPLRFGAWPSDLSPLRALANYSGPVLVIGGDADRSTLPTETRQMFEAASTGSELWLVPGQDHGGVTSLSDTAYRDRIASFLERTIGDGHPVSDAGF